MGKETMNISLILLEYSFTIGWKRFFPTSELLNKSFYFVEKYGKEVSIPKPSATEFNKRFKSALRKMAELEEMQPLTIFKNMVILHKEREIGGE